MKTLWKFGFHSHPSVRSLILTVFAVNPYFPHTHTHTKCPLNWTFFSDILPGMLSARLGEYCGTLKTRDFFVLNERKVAFWFTLRSRKYGALNSVPQSLLIVCYYFWNTKLSTLFTTSTSSWLTCCIRLHLTVRLNLLNLMTWCANLYRKKKKYHWNICIYIYLSNIKKQNGFLMIQYDCVLKNGCHYRVSFSFKYNTDGILNTVIRLSSFCHLLSAVLERAF